MYVKLGELKVNKRADYYDEIVNVLEKNNFVVVKDLDTTLETYYSIAKAESEKA